ncbi:DNA-binding response OmpR family regulator [Streptacidiphilus sp. MAP12-33]|uniref:response regulator transcription factor n=1 Tax=Streptacidiphilus sp. MAP12-33 TaxID=3156266 RepID=UPI0035178659
MVHVLVVGEHAAAPESVVHDLRRQGYDVISVSTGAEARRAHPGADLVLLDLDLPDLDGIELCGAIRRAGDTPVFAFTTRDAEIDRVLALQAGADDCVTKGTGRREVLARIAAIMRRAQRGPTSSRSISLPPLHIDGRTRSVHVDDREVDLTAKEFDLLYALAADPKDVHSRRELMARIWRSERPDSSRTLDTHVSSLRTKLGSGRWIINIRGVGYRIGAVKPVHPAFRSGPRRLANVAHISRAEGAS